MAGEELAAKAGIAVIKEVLPLITDLFGTFKGMAVPTNPPVSGGTNFPSQNSDIAQAIEKVAASLQRLAAAVEGHNK